MGTRREFVATVRKQKLQYFGHIIRAHNLCTHILEGRADEHRGIWSAHAWNNTNFPVNVVLSWRAGAAVKSYRPDLSPQQTFLETSWKRYRSTYAIVSLGPDKMQIHRICEEWSTVKVGSKSEYYNKPGYFEAFFYCCVPLKRITFCEVRIHV